MKQLTLVAAFVFILAMAGMASAQDPVCSSASTPLSSMAKCTCVPGETQGPPCRSFTVESLAWDDLTAGVSGEIC